MRIAFVIIECKLQGGQDQYVFELINHLLPQGHEIHLYSSNVVGNFNGRVTVHHVPALGRIGLLRISTFFFFGTARLWLDQGHYDIIHSAGGNVLGANVITAHYCHPAWLRVKPLMSKISVKWWRNLYDRLMTVIGDRLDRLVYSSARKPAVIAVSQAIKADLRKGYHLSDSQVSVIYNGVNTERFHPRNRELWREVVRARYGIEPDQPILLFIGAFERKGLGYAIEALSHLPSPRPLLLVAGSGQIEPHKRLAAQFGVANQIVWAGHVNEVEQLYAAADIFILPTLYEPFGLVVTEAMASALPVITSRIAGVAEIIEHEIDGLLLDNPTDTREIAQAISLLLSNPLLASSIGACARTKACQYDWRAMTGETELVYKAVLSQTVSKVETTKI
jgi:UDP-glucose:(heptosyl)LPS alpha-1,3-glucosyltransferase